MTIFDFIEDMKSGAPPARAGKWLQENASSMPELSQAIHENLFAPPQVVIEAIARQWPLARIYYRNQQALDFIRELQAWLRKNSSAGTGTALHPAP